MSIVLIGLLFMAIIANIIFHIAEKSINTDMNPLLALSVTYFISFIIVTVIMFFTYPNIDIISNFHKINWAVLVLSLSSLGFDLSILLAYRFGGKMSKLFNIISPGIAISLVLIGVLLYKESLSVYNFVGLILGISGIYLISASEGN